MAGEWLGECRAWGPGQGGGGAKHGSSGGLCSGGGTGASDKLKPPQRPRGHGAASGEQWHPQERSVLGQRGKGRCGFLGRLGGGGGVSCGEGEGAGLGQERSGAWGRGRQPPCPHLPGHSWPRFHRCGSGGWGTWRGAPRGASHHRTAPPGFRAALGVYVLGQVGGSEDRACCQR